MLSEWPLDEKGHFTDSSTRFPSKECLITTLLLFPVPHDERGGHTFFFPTLIINQWDINICILSVNKTYVYCYYFGKHPNIKACFLVQNITSTSLTGYHTYMVGQAFSALNKWNIFAPDSKQ